MIRIVLGVAEQSIAYELRAALSEMDGVDAMFVVESTDEVVGAVLRLDPDVVLMHDRLGPEPALQTVRDLALRRPGTAALVVTLAPTAEALGAAMDAGARGVVAYPLTYSELQQRVSAAADWAAQMRRALGAGGGGPAGGSTARARVITFVGAKGGTGTTTVATHMALDVVRSVPGHRVCLVDLDLEKGDVASILEVRNRASIADVAKVSDDLSAQAVGDAVVDHESGLHLLLAPADVRDVEAVSPRSLREVVAVLRQQYDLVVLDAGSHVTPAQATVVELADEVVAVTTPDVLAMRGLRRSITQWEMLEVRKESDVRVLVNRISRQATLSADTVRQLTRAPVLSAGLPAMYRRLEPALNARNPLQLREDVWWRTLRAIGHEIELVPRSGPASGTAAAELRAEAPRSGKRRRRSGRDTGSVSVETVGILPFMLLTCLLLWQLGLVGMSMVWSGMAASAAARAASVGLPAGPAARDAVPDRVAAGLDVATGGSSVTVRLAVPLVVPGVAELPGQVTTRRQVVREP